MARFDNIYVIDPTEPRTQIEVGPELDAYRASYRWLAYTNAQRGLPVPDDLPGGPPGPRYELLA